MRKITNTRSIYLFLSMILSHCLVFTSDKIHLQNSLLSAVVHNNQKWVEQLLDRGAEVTWYYQAIDYGTLLHFAAEYNYTDLVKLLVAKEAPLNAQDISGLTPLSKAMQYKRTEIAMCLMLNGANPEEQAHNPHEQNPNLCSYLLFRPEHSTPLKIAFHYDFKDIRSFLFDCPQLTPEAINNHSDTTLNNLKQAIIAFYTKSKTELKQILLLTTEKNIKQYLNPIFAKKIDKELDITKLKAQQQELFDATVQEKKSIEQTEQEEFEKILVNHTRTLYADFFHLQK